jgi:hypothetical protein
MYTKEEIKNINLEYQYKINAKDNQFGIEIEFANALYSLVEKRLKKAFYYEDNYWIDSKKEEDKYKTWKLVKDATVQERLEYNKYKGGEINSPILRNDKKSWEELKEICEILRNTKEILIDENCSVHIHVTKHILNKLEEIKNLLKLWIIYEDIIYKFSYGETNEPRRLIYRYAKPYGQEKDILELINKIDDIETIEDFMKIIHYERKFGLNLSNIIKKIQTIEKRTSNGTLNEKIIQNDVRFTLNLFNYAKEENFDKEFIQHKIKNYKPIFLNDSIKENNKKAEELATLIYKDELDKIYFYKQYYKEYNKNDIEKIIHL